MIYIIMSLGSTEISAHTTQWSLTKVLPIGPRTW